MAEDADDDALLLDNEADDQAGDDDDKGQGSDNAGDADHGGEGEDEEVVTFGDEAAPASDEESGTPLIKHLRQQLRDKQRELEEARRAAPPQQEIEVGPKPTMEGCDWDGEVFEAEYLAWQERKAEADKAKSEAQRQAEEVQQAFAKDLQDWETERQSLRVAGKEEASAAVQSTLDQIQLAVLAKAGKDAARLEMGLGAHPARLAQIASIKDPIKLAYALGELKGKIQMTTRRRAPDPEEIARGNARVTQGTDKTLERLEKEAAKTGDRTSLIAYKRQQNSKA